MKLLKSFRALSEYCRGENEPLKETLFASVVDIDDELYNSLNGHHQSILEGSFFGKSKRHNVTKELDKAMTLVLSDTCSTFEEDSQESECQAYQELWDDEELIDSETDSSFRQIEMVPMGRFDESSNTQIPTIRAIEYISQSNSHRSPITQPYIPRQHKSDAHDESCFPHYGQSLIAYQSKPLLKHNNCHTCRDEKSDEIASESFAISSNRHSSILRLPSIQNILQYHTYSRSKVIKGKKITQELLHEARNSYLDGMHIMDERNKDRIMAAFANWLEHRGMVTLRCIKDNCPSKDGTISLRTKLLVRKGALDDRDVELVPTHAHQVSNATCSELSNISNPNICWSSHTLEGPDTRVEQSTVVSNGFEYFPTETSSSIESFRSSENARLDRLSLCGSIAPAPSENGREKSESPPQEYYMSSNGLDTEVEVQLFPPKKIQPRKCYISSDTAGSGVEVQLSPPKKSKKWSGSKLKSRIIAAVKKRSHPFVRKTKEMRRTSSASTDFALEINSLELSALSTATSTSSALSVDLDSLDEQTLVSNCTYNDDEIEINTSITPHTDSNRNPPTSCGCKSLKKAIDNLIACNILTSSPTDIARFLRDHQSRIGAIALGNFLGEAGKSTQDTEYYNLIRYYYVSTVSFKGMDIEQGLRYFLTKQGFRLPGEAQKVDRFMGTFSRCFWENNNSNFELCPFGNQDTVFLLSFAIILLNTDLHRSSSYMGKKVRKKHRRSSSGQREMTKEEFLNNLRGIDHAQGLSPEYLSRIYDAIATNPIALYSNSDKNLCVDCLRKSSKVSPSTKGLDDKVEKKQRRSKKLRKRIGSFHRKKSSAEKITN